MKKKAKKQNKTEQQKRAEQQKGLERQKRPEQPKRAEQQKRPEQQKRLEQQKRAEQPKRPEQLKRAEQQKKAEQQKRAEQPKRPEQQKRPEQPKRAEQQKRPEQQKEPEQQNKTERKNRTEWKEILYNCPYLIAVVITSLAVMFLSDEIGFKAIAAEAETVVLETVGRHMAEQEVSADLTADADTENSEKMENTENMENMEGDLSESEENAGECKNENDDIENENGYYNNDEKTDNTENIKENVKGHTKFEFYEPQEIDSRYYSDAGKVALTTEYPYTKENTSYFNDAAFLGDSRTLGISDYAGLDQADFYCDSGMTIFKLLEEGVTYQKTGDKVDLTQVLQEKQYGKIYIMLGMNELGYGNTGMYLEQYRQVVNQIKEWQPEAIIYIMANLHVSREKNNMETEFNNININDKNAASAQLANGKDIFYLDANPLFTDEEGFLNAELTFDGVHLYAQHYDVWREFLLEHAVEPATEQQDAAKSAFMAGRTNIMEVTSAVR